MAMLYGDAPQAGATTNGGGHARGKELPAEASPYACLISTLDPDGEPFAYRYEQVYLHFPKGVLKQAGGQVQYVEIISASHALYAEDAPREEAVVGRWARCRVPQAEAATALLEKQLRRFRMRRAGETGKNKKAVPARDLIPPQGAATQGAATQGSAPLPDAAQTSGWKRTCASYRWVSFIQRSPEYAIVAYKTCERYKYVYEEGGSDKSGGGSGGGDPGQCSGYNDDGSQLGAEGPGGEICGVGGGGGGDDRKREKKERVPGEIADKTDIEATLKDCGLDGYRDGQKRDHAFSNSIRRAMGLSHRPHGGGLPELDGFAGFPTRLVTGENGTGERVLKALSAQEQNVLTPKGRVIEDDHPPELQDPKPLGEVLVKVYDLYARFVMEMQPSYEDFEHFRSVRSEIGTAVLLCERAVAQGRQVYWTMW